MHFSEVLTKAGKTRCDITFRSISALWRFCATLLARGVRITTGLWALFTITCWLMAHSEEDGEGNPREKTREKRWTTASLPSRLSRTTRQWEKSTWFRTQEEIFLCFLPLTKPSGRMLTLSTYNEAQQGLSLSMDLSQLKVFWRTREQEQRRRKTWGKGVCTTQTSVSLSFRLFWSDLPYICWMNSQSINDIQGNDQYKVIKGL